MAPRHRSPHMNWKRCCPGAPNRYSTRSSPSVMRPKSSATVVVLFAVPSRVRSISAVTSVSAASVVRGVISEMEPTKVVFPTPKPPATTILTGNGVVRALSRPVRSGAGPRDGNVPVPDVSERLKSIEHPFQQSDVGASVSVLHAMDLHESVGDEIADQDARRAERHVD